MAIGKIAVGKSAIGSLKATIDSSIISNNKSASLILPRRFTSQPQGAVEVDWSNPLAKTITHCIPFNGINLDIVNNNPLTLTNGVYVADPRGLSLRGNGSASCASIPLNLSASNRATVSFWLNWDAYANDDDFFFELTSNTNTTDGGLSIDPNSAAGVFAVYTRVTATANGKLQRIARPTAGEWHHYMIAIDRNSDAANLFAVDGKSVTVTYGYNLYGSSAFANSTLYLFSRNNASLFGAGRVQNLIFRSGYLGNEAEAKAEFENPWQLFRAKPRVLYFDASTGSSFPSLSSITASNFTTSGARLTIN